MYDSPGGSGNRNAAFHSVLSGGPSASRHEICRMAGRDIRSNRDGSAGVQAGSLCQRSIHNNMTTAGWPDGHRVAAARACRAGAHHPFYTVFGYAGHYSPERNRMSAKRSAGDAVMVITIRMSPEQKRLIDESPPLKILSAEEADQYLPPLPKTNRACCHSSAD